MKIIRFYSAKEKTWISPGAYWAALKTKKKVHAVMHGKMIVFTSALKNAREVLENSFSRMIQRGATSFFLSLALTLIFFWSPITARVLPEIGGVLKLGFFFSTLFGFSTFLQGILNLRKVKTTPFPSFTSETGIALPAPPMAHRTIVGVKKRYPIIPILFLAFVLFLNSLIIATPTHPAVISGNTIIERPTLVTPFTSWVERPRYLESSGMGIFAVPTENEVWIVLVDYTIYHADLLVGPYDWEAWIEGRLNFFANNVVENIYQEMPVEYTAEEQFEYLKELFSDRALLESIEGALMSQFAERYSGMQMLTAKAKIEMLTVEEYQTARKVRN